MAAPPTLLNKHPLAATRQRSARRGLDHAQSLRYRVAANISPIAIQSMTPRVLVLRAPGSNCDVETAYAFEQAGAAAERIHVNRWLESPQLASDFQILCLPGGFSYGDDLGAGRILGNQLRHHLADSLAEFRDQGKLILGICNGFQILVKSGLLPGPMPQLAAEDWHPTTLTYNTNGRFQDRWVKVRTVSKKSAWLPAKPTILDLPIAHGEGRFVTRDGSVMAALRANDQIAFEYVNADGTRATDFPALPNGSQESIAGICDTTGRVLGLMPHPERIVEPENHPLFTRGTGKADGLIIFESAMAYLQSHQAVTV
jgi:phosphoribosylformylglycinamidine synthase I